jgi:hypothetical protein
LKKRLRGGEGEDSVVVVVSWILGAETGISVVVESSGAPEGGGTCTGGLLPSALKKRLRGGGEDSVVVVVVSSRILGVETGISVVVESSGALEGGGIGDLPMVFSSALKKRRSSFVGTSPGLAVVERSGGTTGTLHVAADGEISVVNKSWISGVVDAT